MKVFDVNKKISDEYKFVFKKLKHEDNVTIFEVIKYEGKEKLENFIKDML